MQAILFLEAGLGPGATEVGFVEYKSEESCAKAFYLYKNQLLVEGMQLHFSSKAVMDKRLAQRRSQQPRKTDGKIAAAHMQFADFAPSAPLLPTKRAGGATPMQSTATVLSVSGSRRQLDLCRLRRELGYPAMQEAGKPTRLAMDSMEYGSQTADALLDEANHIASGKEETSMVAKGSLVYTEWQIGAWRRPAGTEQADSETATEMSSGPSADCVSCSQGVSKCAVFRQPRHDSELSAEGTGCEVFSSLRKPALTGIFKYLLPMECMDSSDAESTEQSCTGSNSEETTNSNFQKVLQLLLRPKFDERRAISTGEHDTLAAKTSEDSSIIPQPAHDSWKSSTPQQLVANGVMAAKQHSAKKAIGLSNSSNSSELVSDDFNSIMKLLRGGSDEHHAEAVNPTGRAGSQGGLIARCGERRKEYCPIANPGPSSAS